MIRSWNHLGQRYPDVRRVIVMIPLIVLLIVANNQRQDSERRHTDERFRQAIIHSNAQDRRAQILANRKFQQAILVTTKQSNYANNRRACGWRAYLAPTLKSYQEAAKDATLTPSARKRNAERIRSTQAFLDNQITVPPGFDCRTLPKKPPSDLP